MLASSGQTTHKEHVYEQHGVELVKGAAIYGANGAGKSNFVKALAALKTMVLEGGRGTLNELRGFKLARNEDKPTSIEIEFIAEGVPFLYGISCYQGLVKEEWLYISSLGKGRDRLLFHRKMEEGSLLLSFADQYTNTDEGRFRLKFYQDELLKEDELLFSELSSLKEGYKEIKQAFNWFAGGILILFPHTKMGLLSLTTKFGSYKPFRQFADEIIYALNTGISNIEVINTDMETFFGVENRKEIEAIIKRLQNGEEYLPLQSRKAWGPGEEVVVVLENDKPVVKQVVTNHKDKEGNLFEFSLDEESDGTNRLLDYIPAIHAVISSDTVVVIDEIDQSIHPALLKELVRKFMSNTTTKGQLIFTTHESNLLDQTIFRRDEIWFAEKHEGATQMYPLSDFDIRVDLDIRKGYLNGRFGAIPFLGNLKDLNWEQHAEA